MVDPKPTSVVSVEVLAHEQVGAGDGFLHVERYRLRNRREDGTTSDAYLCDFLGRTKGPDAVVVALYHRASDGAVRVLLRSSLRPALILGRAPGLLAVPEQRERPTLLEVVAGIIEGQDDGEAGVRSRASIEALEEAGLHVSPDQVVSLGAGTFPSPGSMPEKFFLTAAHVDDPTAAIEPPTDGSPMEEGARCHWMALDAAIAACVTGEIEDAKTELVLRRLRDRLRNGEL